VGRPSLIESIDTESVATISRCDNQGRISFRALDTVRRIERVYAFDIDHEQAERYADERSRTTRSYCFVPPQRLPDTARSGHCQPQSNGVFQRLSGALARVGHKQARGVAEQGDMSDAPCSKGVALEQMVEPHIARFRRQQDLSRSRFKVSTPLVQYGHWRRDTMAFQRPAF